MTERVWYLLVNPVGTPFQDSTADNVFLLPSSIITDFRKAVKAENANKLANVDSSDLKVFKNMDELKAKRYIDEESFVFDIVGQIMGKKDALLVLVPGLAKDFMVVDETSPHSSNSSLENHIKTIDGIDIDSYHLERSELLGKLEEMLVSNSIVLLSSPAGSGKTSLYSLYKKKNQHIKTRKISCRNSKPAVELLKNIGIDMENNTFSVRTTRDFVVVFLDDAQEKYDEKDFWGKLIKNLAPELPRNYRFVICATHDLRGVGQSPVEFGSLPRLKRFDFLLSEKESYEFLGLGGGIGLLDKMNNQTLKDLLVKECGGLVAALRLSVDSLTDAFTKDVAPQEVALLQHCLSKSFVDRMARCFGSSHSTQISDNLKQCLKQCFASERVQSTDFNIEELTYLKKAGILVELADNTVEFSSPLAKRYYSQWIFPNRALDNPLNLPDLITKAISSMSASVLRNSTVQSDFAKEPTFQHLLMEGLARFTRPDCSICPELSKIYQTALRIDGEIDFYLDGELQWGIELLRNGDGIGEHIDRFGRNGKYYPLGVKDYVVVDFRGNISGRATKIGRHSKRITVFFKVGDYSSCECIFGTDKELITLKLSD